MDRAGQLSLTRAQSVALQSDGEITHKKTATEGFFHRRRVCVEFM